VRIEEVSAWVRVEDRGYETPCHIWRGSLSEGGYARARVGRRVRKVLRWVYEHVHGPLPRGVDVDHLCRVRACVRVDHGEAVTHAENMRRGASAKLTAEKVREIRRRRGAGERTSRLAAEFGVAPPTISNIVARRIWTNV
jgi:hypothetical protein